jgi:hypothetical protein
MGGKEMKCYMCGGQYRITIIKGKPYCHRCEADFALEEYGLVRTIKREAS